MKKFLGGDVTTHEPATGIYHKYNVLKLRLLDAAFQFSVEAIKNRLPEVFTTKDLEEKTGISRYRIGSEIAHWRKVGIRYFRRLPKRDENKFIRYKLTKSGIDNYQDLLKRLNFGFDLNRMNSIPKIIKHYDKSQRRKIHSLQDCYILPEQLIGRIGITRYGEQVLGLIDDDIAAALTG